MNSDYQSGIKVGILGGGQLGRMFIQEETYDHKNISWKCSKSFFFFSGKLEKGDIRRV